MLVRRSTASVALSKQLGLVPVHKALSRTACHAKATQRARVATKLQPDEDESLDTSALIKYAGAVTLQTGIMTGALYALQQASQALSSAQLPAGISGDTAAQWLVTAYFLVISIKSRVFSPLPADRPSIAGERKEREARQQPWWTPPPLAFPIIWSLVGLLRATSSVMIWNSTNSGTEAIALPLVVMAFHLAVGDCWNHIRNVERREGVSVPGVFCCWLSVLLVVAAYYQADPTAGLVLAPSAVWITAATLLIYSIWDMNGREGAIYPTKGCQGHHGSKASCSKQAEQQQL